MTSTFFPGCEAAAVGVESLRCINAAGDYGLGWVLILMLGMILWYNLNLESIKDRLATISLSLVVVSMLMVAAGFLPEDAYLWFFVVAIGSVAALMFRK